MRMLLAGNWKMHGLKASLGEIRALGRALADEPTQGHVLVCPPATLIVEAVKAAEGSSIAIGGQDCHAQASGAFTGDISAEMLRGEPGCIRFSASAKPRRSGRQAALSAS